MIERTRMSDGRLVSAIPFSIAFDSAARRPRALSVLAGLLLCVVVAWAGARYWKKTRPAPGGGTARSAP